MMKKKPKIQSYFVGIDWGTRLHAVSVSDEKRNIVMHLKFPHTLDGLEELQTALQSLERVAGVAIEATHLPIFYYLVEKGYTVFPINPKLSKQWREGNSVAGAKSDDRDGRVLAQELARRHESLRPFSPQDTETAELKGLCEAQRNLINRRTALVQQLRADLSVYYPAALDFFSDFTVRSAWDFLKRFSSPRKLAGAPKGALTKFLRGHRIGLAPLWLERIENSKKALAWPAAPIALGKEIQVLTSVEELHKVQTGVEQLDALIAERIKPMNEAEILRSLPGAGDRITPELATMVREARLQDDDAKTAMRCLSGVAPVQNQSGKRNQTRMRRRCNKHWRNTLQLFAFCSLSRCKWARAYYDLCRQRGDRNGTALRKLADRWLSIIHRMIEENQPYDDTRHVNALKKNHSPIYARLCG